MIGVHRSGPIVLNGRIARRVGKTGVDRVAHEVISRLLAMRPELYRLVAPSRGTGGPTQQGWEQLILPVRAARLGASLIYSPANLAPLLWPRNVLVLHDASVWRQPGSYSPQYRAWHRYAERAAAQRALAVITVSEFSRRELIELLEVQPEKVTVIPNGVARRFHPAADPEPVRQRYRLTRPYVLTLARGQARKGLAVLDALARRLTPDGVEVVLAGKEVKAAALDERVRVLGYVSDDDLPGLYAGAELFAFPSLYEGFGIPVLEAMAAGTPVVAADRAALPETCGEAAVLVDPADADRFSAAVADTLADGALTSRLRAAGLTRAAEFTWDRTAAATDELLRRLAGS